MEWEGNIYIYNFVIIIIIVLIINANSEIITFLDESTIIG